MLTLIIVQISNYDQDRYKFFTDDKITATKKVNTVLLLTFSNGQIIV